MTHHNGTPPTVCDLQLRPCTALLAGGHQWCKAPQCSSGMNHVILGQTVPAQSPARWSRGRTIKPGTRQFRGSGTHQTQRVDTSFRTNNKYDQHITQIAKCAFFQLHTCSEKYDQQINSIVVIESVDSKYVAHLERKKSTNQMQHVFSFYLSKHRKVHFYERPQLELQTAGGHDGDSPSWWTLWGESQLVDTMGTVPAGVAATATAAKAAAAGGGYGQSPSWWTLWGQSQLELQQQQQQ